MISLSHIKSVDEGVVKKMIHVPTMTLQIVREIPLENKEHKKELEESLDIWNNDLHDATKVLANFITFWNQPEGCLSLVTEFMGGGSLESLLKNCGFLTEKDIRGIIKQVCKVKSRLRIGACSNPLEWKLPWCSKAKPCPFFPLWFNKAKFWVFF